MSRLNCKRPFLQGVMVCDAGAIVLAVRYRLAPFFRYPVALEECEDVLRAVQQATSHSPQLLLFCI